ncbi:hypothetical protein [Nocardia suismassiliense]|uniref:hypothetical protein n=1 Tax=Nocardia suismassiliense TaxID=2077092 RepID=UPI000D1F777E|nr:hypothetical protein [Nocardia suismassiliense]
MGDNAGPCDDAGARAAAIADNLKYLLNQWDPIGVADLVDDEYECLVVPLLMRLGAGEGRAEIAEFLWNDLEEHFGLNPYHHREHYGVDGLADRLVAWWAVVAAA